MSQPAGHLTRGGIIASTLEGLFKLFGAPTYGEITFSVPALEPVLPLVLFVFDEVREQKYGRIRTYAILAIVLHREYVETTSFYGGHTSLE